MAARSVLTLHPQRLGAVPRDARTRSEPPQSAVVIRLPERISAPYAAALPRSSPRLYVHEGARQALERKLEAASPVPVSLAITDNRHSIISHSWQGGVLRARIHHMFLDAPLAIQTALVRYVTEADRDASLALGTFIESRSDRLAKRSRHQRLVTRGDCHDLLAIFDEVNERYFGGMVNAVITWGTRGPHRRHNPRTTIKLGSYDENERLIRIHPSLDRKWVPRYFVAFIVFHEMLHHMIPARSRSRILRSARAADGPKDSRTPRSARAAARAADGPKDSRTPRSAQAADGPKDSRIAGSGSNTRQIHPPEFREREQTFRHYERALAWERKNLGRLLRS